MSDIGTKPPQQSPHFPDSFHRVAVKGLCVREGNLLLVEDISDPQRGPVWELPGGGLDFGEPIRDALVREVGEEMGLRAKNIGEKPTYIWNVRRENANGLEWWHVVILAYRFEVEDLDAFVKSEECQSIRFVTKEELAELPNLTDQLLPLRELFNPADFA